MILSSEQLRRVQEQATGMGPRVIWKKIIYSIYAKLKVNKYVYR